MLVLSVRICSPNIDLLFPPTAKGKVLILLTCSNSASTGMLVLFWRFFLVIIFRFVISLTTPKINGNKKHVKSYLSDFLFAPERTNSPVGTLSGGERNRLLLARLFARPANVLVLDEPTNDLDIDTLDLLEQLLQDYKGTVFLVSHDRYFLDNVVTSIIAHEGDGFWREFEGGYEDWKIQKARSELLRAATQNQKTPIKQETEPTSATKPVVKNNVHKLNGKERQELEGLPALIEELETEQADIGIAMSNPDLYKNEPELAASMQARLSEITEQLDHKLQRWEALLSRSES